MRPAATEAAGTPRPVPLAETLRRLDAHDVARTIVGRPREERWLGLVALLESGPDEALQHVRSGQPTPDCVGGAAVAAVLVEALVGTARPPLLVERPLPDVARANLSVRWHEAKPWIARVAVHRPRGHVLAAGAGHPDAVAVPTVRDLHGQLVSVVVDAVTPWFGAIRARAPFDRRGMWRQVADAVCSTALRTARAVALDHQPAWDEGQAIVDLVAESVPELRARPRLVPVRWRGGDALWHVKGTCCLRYTAFDDPDPCGEGYCVTCPLRPGDVRLERLRRWLEYVADGVAG